MRFRWIGLWASLALLGGCGAGGGGKVNEQLAEPAALREKKEAIALIRFPPPEPKCTALGMQIGVRQGDLFKPTQTLRLRNLAVTNVLEVLLEPGEYHVLSLTCVHGKAMQTLWEPQGNGLLRRSYAAFSIAAGEVLNAGEIKVVRTDRRPAVVTSSAGAHVEVSDWPLAELERFKSQRPKLFAEMRTRLMTVTPSSAATAETVPQQCAELRQMQASGKVQTLPVACAAAVAKQ